jgi:hypothetical protein
MIGEVIAEFKGVQTGSRVLADGKLEGSSTGRGTLMGKEAMEMDTSVLTPMPNGILMVEGNGMVMTMEGETVMVKNEGIGWLAGKGFKSSARGALFFMTVRRNSQASTRPLAFGNVKQTRKETLLSRSGLGNSQTFFLKSLFAR